MIPRDDVWSGRVNILGGIRFGEPLDHPRDFFKRLGQPVHAASHSHQPLGRSVAGRVVGSIHGQMSCRQQFTPLVLTSDPLIDALGRVVLLLGDAVTPFQDLADDSDIGLHLSLSKRWASEAETAAYSPAPPNWPAFCAPYPGAARTPGPPPGCSSPPPSPPGGPADTFALCTSIAPSIGSTLTLGMLAGGPICTRRLSATTRPRGPICLRRLQLPTTPVTANSSSAAVELRGCVTTLTGTQPFIAAHEGIHCLGFGAQSTP